VQDISLTSGRTEYRVDEEVVWFPWTSSAGSLAAGADNAAWCKAGLDATGIIRRVGLAAALSVTPVTSNCTDRVAALSCGTFSCDPLLPLQIKPLREAVQCVTVPADLASLIEPGLEGGATRYGQLIAAVLARFCMNTRRHLVGLRIG